VATLQMGVLTALVAGCGIASVTLWFFSRRYLGEISLSPSHPGHARFSVLDFWGHREVRTSLLVYSESQSLRCRQSPFRV
jgi:hypothetical protein